MHNYYSNVISRKKAFLLFSLLHWFAPSFLFAQINWQPISSTKNPGEIVDMAISPSGEYFLANSRAIFRSQDGGVNWAELPGGSSWQGLDVLPDGTLIANQGNKIYRMPPGGSGLSEIYEHPLPYFLGLLEHTPDGKLIAWDQNAKSLYTSTDQGTSWQLLYNTNLLGLQQIIAHGGSNNYLPLSPFFIQFEADGSAQKTIYYPGSPTSEPTIALLHIIDQNALIRATLQRLTISLDEGQSWNDLASIPTTSTPISGLNYDLANSRLLASCGDTIWATENLGVNWSLFLTLPKNPNPYFRVEIGNNGTMLAKSGYCDPGTLLRSDNSGQTWTPTASLLQELPAKEIIRDHAGNLYANTNGQSCTPLWRRSTDAGLSWQILRAQANQPSIDALLLTKAGILFGIDLDGRVSRSKDHGANWQQVGNVSLGSQLYEGGDGAIYSVSRFNLEEAFVSDNLGQSWTSLGVMNPLFFATHPDGSLYRMSNISVQKSTDHGFSWSDQPAFPIYFEYNSSMYCAPNGTLYIYGPDQPQLIVSDDGFASYKSISAPRLNTLISDIEGEIYGVASLVNELFKFDAATQEFQYVSTPFDGILYSCSIDRDQYLYISCTHGPYYRSTEPLGSAGVLYGQVQVLPDCAAPDNFPQPNWLVKVQNSSHTFYTSTTALDSSFRFFIPQGNYQLSIAQPDPFFQVCSGTPSVAVPGADTAQLRLLPVQVSCPYLRVASTNYTLRRCFENDYVLSWCNDGNATATDAKLEVTLDPFFEFISASLPVSMMVGNVLFFDLGTLEPNQCGTMRLRIKVSCNADIGQMHCLTTHIFPDTLCLSGLDSAAIYQECSINRGAYDPNDKTAFANGRETSQHYSVNDDLEFLIRFQNTGTDTAFRVVIEDRLSSLLDPGTFQSLIASHPYRWEMLPDYVTGEHVAHFIFDNILLPDSNTNEAASHGFVKFKIRPKQPAEPLAILENYADIFFDYNLPIRTNTVQLSYLSGVKTPATVSLAKISPQPFQDFALVEYGFSGHCRFQLFNPQGQLIKDEPASGGQYILQRSQMPAGVYFCQIISADGNLIAVGRMIAR